MKKCIKCKTIKEESAFYPNITRKDGLHNTCIQCQKDYYQKNKEYFKQYKKTNPDKFGTNYYMKKIGNIPEKVKKLQKKKQKEYFERHQNTEEFKIRKRRNRRAYRLCHPERERNGLFKERQLSEIFTDEEWENKVKEANGICFLCNRFFEEGYGLSLDHNPPISKAPIGFIYTIDDVQPICRSCNSSKGASI